jgi:hypothetical protein
MECGRERKIKRTYKSELGLRASYHLKRKMQVYSWQKIRQRVQSWLAVH